MPYVIQNKNGLHFRKLPVPNTAQTVNLNDIIRWERGIVTIFKTEEEASQAIKRYNLGPVEVITLYNNNVDNMVNRLDRNMAFIREINEKASKFKMKSVGIKSIDKLINTDIGYSDNVAIKRNNSYLCEIGGQWCEVYFTHVKKGVINIINYTISKIIPQTNERIVSLRRNNEGIYKLVTALHNHVTKNSEIDYENKEYIIENIHEFLKMIDGLMPQKINSKIEVINARRNYNNMRKLPCLLDTIWYEATFDIDKHGQITIISYIKIDKPKTNTIIGVLEKNPRFGINKMHMETWGIRFQRKDTHTITNPHNLIKEKLITK